MTDSALGGDELAEASARLRARVENRRQAERAMLARGAFSGVGPVPVPTDVPPLGTYLLPRGAEASDATWRGEGYAIEFSEDHRGIVATTVRFDGAPRFGSLVLADCLEWGPVNRAQLRSLIRRLAKWVGQTRGDFKLEVRVIEAMHALRVQAS